MVKLPELEQSKRVRGRSHHTWGARLGRGRQELRLQPEPTGLLQLEELAERTVSLMEKYSPKSEHNYNLAMDLLRQQYNLNFIVVCEKCRGTHYTDEILAPER